MPETTQVRRGRPPGIPWRSPAPMPEWMEALRPGDVLRWPSGDLRVVRNVSRWGKRGRPERVRYVTFAIRRRSWTNRATTVYAAHELVSLGVQPVGARVRLDREMDRLVQAAIDQRSSERPYVLTAADVRGVP